jgi:hypothetical protein
MDDLKTLKDYLSNSIVSPKAKQELIGYLDEALSIEFLVKEAWIPQQRGINADERELGIAIQEVRLV